MKRGRSSEGLTAICVWASGVILFESQRPIRRPRAFNNLTLGSPTTHLEKAKPFRHRIGSTRRPQEKEQKTLNFW